MYTREKEIRKLSAIQLYELAQILDLNDSWKKLMRIIPKNPFSDAPEDKNSYKYNLDHVRLIENASKNQHRMAAEILFEEWGTSGRMRPTLGVLLELLAKAQLFRAADLVAIKYLNEPPPARPTEGPAAKVDISIPLDSEFVHNLEDMLENGDDPGTETLNDNANPCRLADNNIDYYEKYVPNEKRLSLSPQINGIEKPSTSNAADIRNTTHAPIERSDLMKFSSTIVAESQEVIPMLSELQQQSITAPSDSNNSSGIINTAQNSSNSIDLPVLSALAAQQSCIDVPILSVLNQQSSSSVNLPNLSVLNTQSSIADDIIPNLSTLNVHDITQTHSDDKSNLKPLNDLSPSKQSSSSGASTISSSSDDGDDDISAPNLSILDQRSSNNDSSLTNVTATSEDNSFEISLNEGSTSYDNIPCLSALK